MKEELRKVIGLMEHMTSKPHEKQRKSISSRDIFPKIICEAQSMIYKHFVSKMYTLIMKSCWKLIDVQTPAGEFLGRKSGFRAVLALGRFSRTL